MRAGVRARIVRLGRTAGSGARRLSWPILLGALCAGAFAPVLAVPGAWADVSSSVGGNILADVLTRWIGWLREGDRERTPEAIEDELQERIEQALTAGGESADGLRRDIAEVLREIGAAEAALQEAVETGDGRLQAQLASGLAALGEEFAEFRFLLVDVSAALADIQEALDRQGSEHRVIVDLLREQASHMRLVREDVSVIERRVRSGFDGGGPGPDGTLRWVGGCPYQGLSRFEEDQSPVFYGREQATAELVGRLSERLTGPGLIVVTGASGAGKSSLLRAGLLPALARGSLSPQSVDWPRLVITPTRSPLQELATHLAALAGADPAAVLDGLRAHPERAHLVVRQAVLADSGRHGAAPRASEAQRRLVLVVDQFEEMFTSGPGSETDTEVEAERLAFITALHAAASAPSGPHQQPVALVVIAVRGDFLDRSAAYRELREALADGPFVVSPMAEPDLRRAITGPAAAAGLELEHGLTDTILADLRSSGSSGGYEAGALPWLSQAMLITWEHRENGRLTSRGYGMAGGVRRAVQTSAEDAYASLSGPQQHIAGQMFQVMTVVARDGQLARRRRVRSDLYLHRTSAERADIDAVLEAFAAKRLIVLSGKSAEIAHDELIRAWSRLRGWLEPELAGHVLYGQFLDDVEEWVLHHRDPSFLYRGTRLAAVQQAATRWEADPARYPLDNPSREFLDACTYAARRSLRQRRTLLSVLASLVTIAVIAAVIAVHAADDAGHQHTLALSRQLAAQSEAISKTDPVVSALLAAAAWRTAPTAEARYSMRAALHTPRRGTFNGNAGPVTAVAFSPDGKTVATGSNGLTGSTTRLWDVATGRPIGAPLYDERAITVQALAFSSDGKTLATASDADERLWDVATRREIGAPLSRHQSFPSAAAFSRDGKTLATTTDTPNGTVRRGQTIVRRQTIQLWDVTGHRQIGKPITSHFGPVPALAFSPDGKTLAVAVGLVHETVSLWDVAKHRPIGAPLTSDSSAAQKLAFSPDGKTLAIASGGTTQLWDVTTHHLIGKLLSHHAGTSNALAFSPDGRTLATTTADQTVQLWDVGTHLPIGVPLAGFLGAINAVAFSPDGKTLVTATDDQTARLWNTAINRQIGAPLTVTADDTHISLLAFASDGKTLTSWSTPSAILKPNNKSASEKAWDLATHRQINVSSMGRSEPVVAVLSPDHKTLATWDSDQTIRLRDAATHRQIDAPLSGRMPPVRAMAFSPDSKDLTAWTGQEAHAWEVASHRDIPVPRIYFGGSEGSVNGLTFSPDSKILATWTNDRTVRLWDQIKHRQLGAPLAGIKADAAAFSPDGATLAVIADNKIVLWDIPTHRQIGAAITSGSDILTEVTFSPDGKTVATAGQGDQDETVRLWDVSEPTDPLRAICASAGRSLTHADWDRYAPGEKFRHIC